MYAQELDEAFRRSQRADDIAAAAEAKGYKAGLTETVEKAIALASGSRDWASTPEEVERWDWHIDRLRALAEKE